MVRASGIARAIERKPKIIPKATLAVRMMIPSVSVALQDTLFLE
jgi:hypothetical protein